MFYRENLKKIRKTKKITQYDLAKALGKSRIIVSYWEQGRRRPCESDIRMMATFLDIPFQEISDLSEPKQLKSLQNTDLLNAKLKEIDYLIKEYGDLPVEVIYKIKQLKDSFIDNYSSFFRAKRNTLKYDLLLQNLPFIFYVKNDKFKYSYANEAFLNLLGEHYNREDIIGTSYIDFFGFNDYDQLIKLEKETFSTKEKISNHQIVIPGTRGKRIGLLSIIPVLGYNNEVTEIMCSIRDITDNYEEQNRRKELEYVTNKINHLIWIGEASDGTEKTLKYIYLSDNVSEIYGFEKHEALKDNMLWFKIIHKEYIDKVRIWQNERAYPSAMEYKINNPKKGERWVRSEIYKEEKNKYFGIVKDITEDKEKEYEKEAILRTLDSGKDAIKIARNQGKNKKYIYVNQANEDLYEIPLSKIKDDLELWKDFLHPEDKQKVILADKEAHCNLTLDYKLLLPNGKIKYIEENFFRTIIDHIKYTGMIKRDITSSIEKNAKNESILKVLDFAGDSIWINSASLDNKKSETIFANKARKMLYNLSFTQMQNNPFFWKDFIHPEDMEHVISKSLSHTHGKLNLKYRLTTNNNIIKHIEESLFSIIVGNTKYSGGIQRITKIEKEQHVYIFPDKNDDCFYLKVKDEDWSDGGYEDKLLLKAFLHIPENQRKYILDAGCGMGKQITKLAMFFHKIIAIDPDLMRLEFAKSYHRHNSKISFQLTDIQTYKTETKFDCIFCRQVIQHVKRKDVAIILKKFYSLLNDDGYLILLTTNCLKEKDNYVKVDLRDAKHFPITANEYDKSIVSKNHFLATILFTEKTLRDLLKDAGFEINFIEKFNGYPKVKGDNFILCKKISI